MKQEEVRENCMIWSKRLQCYGQSLEKKGFMVFMLFVKHPPIWLHCSELCLDPRMEDEKWIK